MSSRPFPEPPRRLAAAAALALLAGLLAGGCGVSGRYGAAPAEPVEERLANQARAVALLSEENRELRERIAQLEAELAALRAAAGRAGAGKVPPGEGE